VEGSITIALAYFEGSHASTAYAVLMYRAISFWLVLVVGWILWGQLAYQVRKGRWSRQALESPVEGELVPDALIGTRAPPDASASPAVDG
jgi:hypothetical protein